MNKNKGFTLVELLAVILVLGIVAVISVPVVKNITNDAKQKGFDKQVNTILASARNWAIKNTNLLPETDGSILVKMDTLKNEGFLENKVITNPVNQSEMNGCAKISYDANFNQYEYEYNENCQLYSVLLSELVTTSQELGVNSVASCATGETECTAGTAFAIKVNDTGIYKFYVLSDDGNQVTLIMNQNLGERIPWLSAEDYQKLSSNPAACNWDSCNDVGPITAIEYLDELTDDEWINIPQKTYIYSGISEDDKTRIYQDITKTMRVRMLTFKEAVNAGCTEKFETCPNYLADSLYSTDNTDMPIIYWTSTAASVSKPLKPGDTNFAWHIPFTKNIDTGVETDQPIDFSNGVRPVIELSKIEKIY